MTSPISVVIPAFNEERRLPARLEEIASYLQAKGLAGEIVVVDDGSVDRTTPVVEHIRDRETRVPVRLIRHPVNHGKGCAVRTGVLAAACPAVLVSDADDSTPIGEIERLWPSHEAGIPVVIGSRRAPGDAPRVEQPPLRALAGRVFNLAVSLAGLRGLSDTQCGFKLFDRAAVRPIFAALRTVGFAFDVEVLLRARSRGLRIAEVGVRWTHAEDSRVRLVRDSARMILEIVRMRVGS